MADAPMTKLVTAMTAVKPIDSHSDNKKKFQMPGVTSAKSLSTPTLSTNYYKQT